MLHGPRQQGPSVAIEQTDYVTAESPTGREPAREPMVRRAHGIEVTRPPGPTNPLSAERKGRFICTDAYCRSLWTPLVVPKGVKSTVRGCWLPFAVPTDARRRPTAACRFTPSTRTRGAATSRGTALRMSAPGSRPV